MTFYKHGSRLFSHSRVVNCLYQMTSSLPFLPLYRLMHQSLAQSTTLEAGAIARYSNFAGAESRQSVLRQASH